MNYLISAAISIILFDSQYELSLFSFPDTRTARVVSGWLVTAQITYTQSLDSSSGSPGRGARA